MTCATASPAVSPSSPNPLRSANPVWELSRWRITARTASRSLVLRGRREPPRLGGGVAAEQVRAQGLDDGPASTT